MKRDTARILRNAVGDVDRYCTGAGFAPGDCYLTAPSVSIGVVPCLPVACGSVHLNNTIAYDAAEAGGVHLGQTNMIAVSSFCGLNGLVLGLDLLKVDSVPHEVVPEFRGMPVYDMATLERATMAIFGTAAEPRYPLMPGELVPCAYKTLGIEGDGVIWGALALAIAKDRSANADLFMEELGGSRGMDEISPHEYERILESILLSVAQVSRNLGVEYDSVYIEIKADRVPVGHYGCALAASPYFKLARAAVPASDPAGLAELRLDEWEAWRGESDARLAPLRS